MRLSCKYDILLSVLQDVASVVEDSMADAETQNIIFRFQLDEDGTQSVKLVGYSPTIIYKREFGDESSYDLSLDPDDVKDNGVGYFQIKSKDILGFLNSYKSLKRTKVKEVIFEPVRGKIKCTMVETPQISPEKQQEIDEAREFDSGYVDPIEEREYVSQYMFSTPPMKPNIIQRIEYEAPGDGYQELEDSQLKVYTETMFKNLENVNGLYGTMCFLGTHVGVSTRSFTSVMQNFTVRQGEESVFVDIGLSYKVLSFIDKIVCRCRFIKVAKAQNKLFFQLDTGEACVDYITKGIQQFDMHRSLFKKDSFFVLDKLYFRDILKRTALSDASIRFCVHATDGRLSISNGEYEQDIEFLSSHNIDQYENMSFTVMPVNANSALLETEKFLPDEGEMYVYLCAGERKEQVYVCFADKQALWFSMLKTRVN